MSITDGFELIAPEPYTSGPPHDLWTKLRNEAPLHYCEPNGYPPFWAVTRHADICAISKNPTDFLSDPGITVPPDAVNLDRSEGVAAMRTIIEMDPPRHRSYRKVASPYFTPRALARVDASVNESARTLVDRRAEAGTEGECDFATDIAAAHPLRILSTILGIPREQEARILELTNQLFAPDDDELGFGAQGEVDRSSFSMRLGLELYQLFEPIIADRKANPRDDLASILANGVVDGEPMGPMETFGYYLITFTAGHDTTKNALAGGLRAFAENPDQWQKVRSDPSLVPSAVEEMVRWASPVNYMRRTAARDLEFGGQQISAGDYLVLFYASGNRDASVFADPFRFDVTRDPNRHVGFGHGEHFCLGAHLARRSQQAILRELTRRIESVELAGEPEWIKASFVVGHKHLPIRYRMAEA